MSESARKLIERLVSNVLRVHGLQFQKNIHGEMIQEFLVELFQKKGPRVLGLKLKTKRRTNHDL